MVVISTKKQRQKIAIMRKQAFQDEDSYRGFLQKRYGVRSCTEISKYEAIDCIDVLEHLVKGKLLPPQRRRFPFLSHAQYNKLQALVDFMEWNEERINGFIQRQTGKQKTIDMLTGREATKVIVGMQKIYAAGDRSIYNRLNRAEANDIKAMQTDHSHSRAHESY